MLTAAALAVGFLLDCLLGDPRWLPHPVRAIGGLIAGLEKLLRRPAASPAGQLAAGALLWCLVAGASFAVPLALVWAAGSVSPWLRFALESVMIYQLLAARDLVRESMRVHDRLAAGDLPGARQALSMIVGRDTDQLDEGKNTCAAVETVAENASDGVIAPLLFAAVGGPALGFLYKAVNTMDSMLGYRNEKYLYFGRVSARMDDAFNFLPARISALAMVLAAFLLRMDARGAWSIWRRDRKNHKSPNSAQTESACAGALGIRLGGPSRYFGQLVEKPYLGDDRRPPCREDIPRAGRLMYAAAVIVWLCCLAARIAAAIW